MAVVGRINGLKLWRGSPLSSIQLCSISTSPWSKRGWSTRRKFYTALGIGFGSVGFVMLALDRSVSAYDYPLHPPAQKWNHVGVIDALDHASLRRGYAVYRNVCAACHSMQFIPFRRLVNVAHTEAEMKEIAAEYQVRDGPDEEGKYFMRPGKLADYFPKPYENDEAAAFANNGAVPPDLSLMTLAREGGEDYVFALLTSFTEPPAGVTLSDTAHYNPYFQGSIIAMAPPLYNGIFEYEDGTPATLSQLAKDVSTFLVWAAQPEHDKRKQWLIKGNLFFVILMVAVGYINRHKWTSMQTRKIAKYVSSKKD